MNGWSTEHTPTRILGKGILAKVLQRKPESGAALPATSQRRRNNSIGILDRDAQFVRGTDQVTRHKLPVEGVTGHQSKSAEQPGGCDGALWTLVSTPRSRAVTNLIRIAHTAYVCDTAARGVGVIEELSHCFNEGELIRVRETCR